MKKATTKDLIKGKAHIEEALASVTKAVATRGVINVAHYWAVDIYGLINQLNEMNRYIDIKIDDLSRKDKS
jgi:hypothetical protein